MVHGGKISNNLSHRIAKISDNLSIIIVKISDNLPIFEQILKNDPQKII
jgi:hypothetical protein